MPAKKILITGAGGMLGKDIVTIFSGDSSYTVMGALRNKKPSFLNVSYETVDLRDSSALKKLLSATDPDIIIHSAAIVDLNACEKNPKDADLVHIEATKILASHKNGGVKFVYISTDSVFDGEKGNYSETDKTHPINYYASSKLEGEKIALAENKNSLIIRTNIYGFHTDGGASLAEWALENLKKRKTINGFTDVIFNPLYTRQLARIIKQLVANNSVSGILNIGSESFVNKYDFLQQLAESFSWDKKLINPTKIDETTSALKRPKNTSLNIEKFSQINKGAKITLSSGLKEFASDYKV